MGAESIRLIEGINLNLRLVELEDAEYIHALRINPAYNAHLSEVRGTAEDQQRWIESYKMREAAGLEYYYMITRADGQRCGLVRLYDIAADSFTWGSWILGANKPPKAALESAVLSFGVGFDVLGKTSANIDVRRDNRHAQAFYRRLGMEQIAENECDIFFTYSNHRYAADRAAHYAMFAPGA